MAQRKLQSEIDRTLKKVAEGVELFESIYEKMQASTNQTQKEKQEIDLKTQIKKLQRLRDQIKTWVASNDIKDKSALLDNRKLIETQMERFKACEKEMKTKAFSKEGLTAALKLDPKAQEKNEAIAWLQSMVDELGMQLEAAEAEVETLQGGQKKKGKGAAANERLDELEHMNERRKWHIGRLELILRLLENGTLATEKATQLKEDVSYFVESNAEEGFEEDEGIYDELNLDEEELRFKVGLAADEGQSEEESIDASEDLPPRTPAKEPPKKASNHDDDVSHKKEEVASPVLKRSGVALRKQSIAEATKPPIPTANFSQQPMASILKQNLPAAPRAAPPTLTPIRYSAAVTAASAPQTTASSSHPAPTPALPSTASVAASNSSSSQATGPQAPAANDSPHSQEQAGTLPSPSLTHPSISAASPMLSVSTSAHPAPSHVSRMTPPPSSVGFLSSRDGSPALSEAIPAATSSPIRLQPAGGILASENPDISQASLTLSPPSGSHASLQTLGPNSTLQAQGQSSHALSPRPPQPQNSDVPSLPTQPQEPASSTGPTASTRPPSIPPMSSLPAAPTAVPQYPPGVNVPGLQKPSGSTEPIAPLAQDREAVGRPGSTNVFTGQESMPRSAGAPNTLPNSLADLLVSFDGAKQKATNRMTDLNHVHKLLEAGYPNMPQPQDTAKPKYYVPKNPHQTPSYYPQMPNPVLSTSRVFAQLDVETLFYVFYYLPGTYQQYLAAKELKKQSWRFHVKYLTWFQRHSEPQAITEEYEQGVYVYFDWEGSWCQRKKSDFRFEYRYLSED